jgi:D-amino-acid oxidase
MRRLRLPRHQPILQNQPYYALKASTRTKKASTDATVGATTPTRRTPGAPAGKNHNKTLVVGSGAIGLQTALECVHRGRPVVVRSPFPPSDPRNCSVGAGGLWFPFHVEGGFVTRWALETLDALLAVAARDASLVEVVPAVVLLQQHQGPVLDDYKSHADVENPQGIAGGRLPGWAYDKRLDFQHLTVEMLSWQNAVHKLRIPDETTLKEAGYRHAWLFHPPIVNPSNMLQYMLGQLEDSPLADVDVSTNHFLSDADELCRYAQSLECTSVINCTGLGSRALCRDDQLIGARGILWHYDRLNCPRIESVAHNPLSYGGGENTKDAVILVDEGPWGSTTMPAYIIPRGDTIVLGGSCLDGDTEAGIRPAERERLLLNAQRLGIDTAQAQPVGEWTGYRPFRSSIRCEVDHELMSKHSLTKVVHNYGHGGAGWTLGVGAAKHAVDLLEQ